MWMQDDYEGYEGKYWSCRRGKVLPKPYVKPHPAMWYAAGNTSSYEMAARRGLGVLGFSVQSLEELGPVLRAYKGAIANAEPVGAFVNDNLMVTASAWVAEDRGPCSSFGGSSRGSPISIQHVPLPRHLSASRLGPAMARPPTRADRGRCCEQRSGRAASSWAIPTTRWRPAGAGRRQAPISWSSRSSSPPMRTALETIRLMGEYVIPKLDTDPEHRTSRFRREAAQDSSTG